MEKFQFGEKSIHPWIECVPENVSPHLGQSLWLLMCRTKPVLFFASKIQSDLKHLYEPLINDSEELSFNFLLLSLWIQTRNLHACFLSPGPPNRGLSKQLWHSPQSSLVQPSHSPHLLVFKDEPL